MPSPTASFEVWDVVRVPFPYTDRPVQQHRPALVVARHDQADCPLLLWVLMITSAVHRRWLGDVEVTDLALAGLPKASIVRSAKIATIEASQAGKLGSLPTADRIALRQLLAAAFAPTAGGNPATAARRPR